LAELERPYSYPACRAVALAKEGSCAKTSGEMKYRCGSDFAPGSKPSAVLRNAVIMGRHKS
jgi:hypothetical protein